MKRPSPMITVADEPVHRHEACSECGRHIASQRAPEIQCVHPAGCFCRVLLGVDRGLPAGLAIHERIYAEISEKARRALNMIQ